MFKTITRAAVLAVVAGGVSLAAVVPAQAQVPTTPPAEGRRCTFASVTDPTLPDEEVQTGQINGGPLVADQPGATIQLICTLQTSAANQAHNGTDACAVIGTPSLQVATAGPATCSYASPEGQPVYMCSQVNINGVPYYWDGDPLSATAGTWSLSSSVGCNLAISQEIFPGPICLVTPTLYTTLGGNGTDYLVFGGGALMIGPDGDVIVAGFWIDCLPRDNPPPGPIFPDGILCPILISLAPGVPGVIDINSEGDVAIAGIPFWDCPPYSV